MPVFFCPTHPKFQLNMVCVSRSCNSSGLVCARCIEEHYSNVSCLHDSASFICLDDLIFRCSQVAQPILTATPRIQTHHRSPFDKLAITLTRTIESLRRFSESITHLTKQIEMTLCEQFASMLRGGFDCLEEIGDLLRLVHTPNSLSDIMRCIPGKHSTNPSLHLNQQYHERFQLLIDRIAHRLIDDPHLQHISDLSAYIETCDAHLHLQHHSVQELMDDLLARTQTNLQHSILKSSTIPQQSPSNLLFDIIYENTCLSQRVVSCLTDPSEVYYSGEIPSWMGLVEVIKDLQQHQTIFVSLTDKLTYPRELSQQIQKKCLLTTVGNLFASEHFLSAFTARDPLALLTLQTYENDAQIGESLNQDHETVLINAKRVTPTSIFEPLDQQFSSISTTSTNVSTLKKPRASLNTQYDEEDFNSIHEFEEE